MNNKNVAHYCEKKFFKRLATAKRQSTTKPNWGKRDCKEYQVPTVAVVFSDARRVGLSIANQIRATADREAKIRTKVKATHRKYAQLWQYKDEIDDAEFASHARDLGNTLHDVPYRWTGYETQASIGSKEPRCKEHFHPRLWAGHQIMNFIFDNDGITFGQLYAFFEVFRQIHYSTSKENTDLMQYQDTDKFTTWQEAYEKACSPLIQVQDNGPILTLEDFGDVFTSLHKYNSS